MSLFTFRFTACLLVALLSSISTAQAENRDEIIFFFNDALGSAVAAVNEEGELCWSENYTPYGDKTVNDDVFSPPGSGCGIVGEERGFTGHTEDVNSDLVYMQQRYYDPSIGRFLSIDPLDSNPNDPNTYNRYAYANNNPYKYTDPNGEAAVLLLAVPSVLEGAAALGAWVFSAKGAAIVGSAAVGAYAGNKLLLEPMLSEKSNEIPIEDLNPLHPEETVGERPDLEGLSDEELLDTVVNPANGDPIRINTKTGRLVDGNSRAHELKKRANDSNSTITSETTVPVDEYSPDDSMFWDH